ncbi:RNA methyltransferase [Porphyromonas cangingivalis]|uniref:RNA methyltransferase n=1 Tax=Porphyromonas cangingivalis TaxID=36874 RepID=A0A099WZQ1_PORCN|nr:RNA methyltransferase [Porphyromonas cangingivalis]KGL50141.1 RNA methyltransferase [Porphyromonas cangingivalis]KGN80193.1 RNA methyltransferase [Porphyromonas cangingivalis]
MNRKLSIQEMDRLTPSEFSSAEKVPVVIVLDNVRSMNNIGAVFRTADALRIERVCLCGISATPPHPDIHKTALGAEEVVSWKYYPDTSVCVQELKSEGYKIWCVEQAEGSIFLDEFAEKTPCEPIALVVGNEVKGVDQSVIDAGDGCIEIRQYGTKHSLNVSVAGGIVMWEVCKRFER